MRTEGFEWTGQIDGMRKERKMLICERHKKELVEPLKDALLKYGTSVDAEEKAPKVVTPTAAPKAAEAGSPVSSDTFDCPVQPCDKRGSKSMLTDHVQAAHGVTLAQVAYESGHTLEGAEITHVCRLGRCKAKPSGYAHPQAIVQHAIRTHRAKTGEIKAEEFAV
jgi:hypothetical protein